MTAPDPKWVEAVARALHARYCTCGSPDRIERRNAGIAVAAVEPLIREQIAQQIEADLRAKANGLMHWPDSGGAEVVEWAAVLALFKEVQ